MALPIMKSEAIDSKLRQLLGAERNTKVDFLLHLDMFDQMTGFEKLGYTTLWDYCVRELGLLEGAVWYRTQAMYLLRKFPQVELMLRDGRLCPTALVKLKDVLTPENASEIFQRAAGKSFRDVLIIAAALNPPAPDKPATFLKVSVAKAVELGVLSGPPPVRTLKTEASPALKSSDRLPGDGLFGNAPANGSPEASVKIVIPVPLPEKCETLKALAEDQFRWTMLVRRAVVEKSDRLKKLLSHVVPDGDLAKIVEICFDAVLEKYAKKHAPRKRTSSKAKKAPVSDAIPADVAADVWTECDGKCQWVLANGEKCGSEHQVQYDHRTSRAKGGTSTRENLWLLCRLHNIMKARLEFGDAHMAQFRRRA